MRVFWRTYGLTLLSGVLLSLCFPRAHFYLIAWVALVPLWYRTHTLTPRQSFLHFFLAGWVFHTILLQWLATNIYWAGGWAIIGQQLMCVALSVYWGLLGLTWAWLRDRLPRALAWAAIPVLWIAMEQLQATLFTGFGWSSLAYSQGPDLPLLQWAAIGGAPLVSGIIVCGNVLLVLSILNARVRFQILTAFILLVAVSHAVGYALLHEPEYNEPRIKVGLFQSNFPLEMKWDPEYTLEMVQNAMDTSRVLVEHEAVDLVVWPEALVMTDVEQPSMRAMLGRFARESEVTLFTGGVGYARAGEESHSGTYNSAFLFSDSGELTGRYDKLHLAPFGEYIPYASYIPFVNSIVPMIGGIRPGKTSEVFPVEDRAFGPLICFEVLFPWMSERLRNEGADFLVVITNMGWFGASNAIPQEIEIARLRAIETRLPLLHAANTGISGLFDPWGRFTLANGVVHGRSEYRKIRDDVEPGETIRRRLVGSFALPQPGQRPLPIPPNVVPWASVALCAALLSWTAFFRRRNGDG